MQIENHFFFMATWAVYKFAWNPITGILGKGEVISNHKTDTEAKIKTIKNAQSEGYEYGNGEDEAGEYWWVKVANFIFVPVEY